MSELKKIPGLTIATLFMCACTHMVLNSATAEIFSLHSYVTGAQPQQTTTYATGLYTGP